MTYLLRILSVNLFITILWQTEIIKFIVTAFPHFAKYFIINVYNIYMKHFSI